MTASTAGTPPATDLLAVADRLTRAADAIRTGTTEFDPTPFRPLARSLDDAADAARAGGRGIYIELPTLAEAARLLLGEEDGDG